MSLDLDRSKWTRVTFGEVADRVRSQVKRGDVKRYVAGGHFDDGSLEVTRWGYPDDGGMGSTFTYGFQSGHTLFVSASWYLRKIAVATFEGVVADKTYVLAPRDPNVLDPRFLPFLILTDRFHDYAAKQATGSMNARLLWSALCKYEFDLPPLDQQRRLADLLWAVEAHEKSLESQLATLKGSSWNDQTAVRLTWLNHSLSKADDSWSTAALGQIGSLTRGRRFTQGDYVDEGIGSIHYAEIHTHYDFVATEVVKFVPSELGPSLRFAQTGDLVIAGTSETASDVCRVVAWLGAEEVAVHDDCFIFRHNLDPSYASLLFASADFQRQKARYVSESKVVRVSADNLAQIAVPVPPRLIQEQIVTLVGNIDRAIELIREEAAALKELRFRLLDEILGDLA